MTDWLEWLTETRFTGWSEHEIADALEELSRIRDRVLQDAGVGPGNTVVDVGAGTGLLTFGARERVHPEGSVVAVDPDAACLDELRRLATSGDISFLLGRAEALPLPDDFADAVVTRSVLIYVGDLAETAQEFFRVLRPGGRAAGFEPLSRKSTYMHDVIDWNPLGSLGTRVYEDSRRFIFEEDPLSRLDDEELAEVFTTAGFDVDVDVLFEDAPFEATREAIDVRLDAVAAPGHPSRRQRLQALYAPDEVRRIVAFLYSLDGQTIPIRWASLFFRAVKPS